jgi:hypothetical protein
MPNSGAKRLKNTSLKNTKNAVPVKSGNSDIAGLAVTCHVNKPQIRTLASLIDREGSYKQTALIQSYGYHTSSFSRTCPHSQGLTF